MNNDPISDNDLEILTRPNVVIPQQHGILAHYSALPHREGSPILATIDLHDPRNRALVHAAVAGESASLWDLCERNPAEIEVQDIIAHYAEYESDETPGEIRQYPMLTLIGPAGCYHTGSQFAFRALQLCAQLGDIPPWNPPMRFQVRRASSRARRQYQTLICLGRSVV